MIPNDQLSSRQLRLLAIIIQIQHRGETATIQKIKEESGFHSPTGVIHHLESLEKKGMVNIRRDYTGRIINGTIQSAYRMELFPEAFGGIYGQPLQHAPLVDLPAEGGASVPES